MGFPLHDYRKELRIFKCWWMIALRIICRLRYLYKGTYKVCEKLEIKFIFLEQNILKYMSMQG